MNRRRKPGSSRLFTALPALLLLGLGPGIATAQAAVGTAFTYQGQLQQSGVPTTGAYDFEFNLYDHSDPVSGTLLGTVTVLDVGVSNGIFTVELDFGDLFDGGERWLEVGVQPAGSGPFSYLAPLQALTPTPYSIFAADADQLDGLDASDFVTTGGGTISGELVVTGKVTTGGFEMSAGAAADRVLTSDASGVGTWQEPPAAADDDWTVVGDDMVAAVSGNVGIGSTSPGARLEVRGPDSDAVENLVVLRKDNGAGAGKVFVVQFQPATPEVLLTTDGSVEHPRLSLGAGGSARHMTITTGGNVGIGTPGPGERLSVAGRIESLSGGFRFPDGTVQTSAAAPPAAVGLQLVVTTHAYSGSSSPQTFQVYCPSGKRVLGGGFEMMTGSPTIKASHPSGPLDSWVVKLSSVTSGSIELYATCAAL